MQQPTSFRVVGFVVPEVATDANVGADRGRQVPVKHRLMLAKVVLAFMACCRRTMEV